MIYNPDELLKYTQFQFQMFLSAKLLIPKSQLAWQSLAGKLKCYEISSELMLLFNK
uniref:Uncharacterized protein n=1 Tax=Physcomitrium patens TaxID=3218 RepID=A0A2K1KVX2_PHYPA|nr:hypothetical protein PHYPA_004912 [Physcomitrium patens]